ncbi:MAG: DoxX family membrane protein [Bacteroidales bacterium]|nr:DoxX family membrane protein [Bacteroidales bacterium]
MTKKEPVWLKIIRILLGCLFLFSSFTKAIDPVGFGVTMNDYFVSFHMGFLHPLSLFAAVVAITCEFVLGCMLLFRVKVQWAAWGYLLFMTFFFFLTMWLAIAEYLEVKGIHYFGVVKDCGCFGDVIEMSNKATFLKNVVFIIPTLIVFFNRKKISDCRLSELGQWLCVGLFALVAVGFQLYVIRHLPFIGKSDWNKGKDVSVFVAQPAQKDVVFVYKNNETGEEITLTQDELMNQADDFYEKNDYVSREDKILKEAVKAKIDGFNMLDENGADHAPDYFATDREGDVYILYVHDLNEANAKGMQKAIALAKACESEGVDFVGITNSSEEEIAKFVEKYGIEFPIYYNPINPITGPFMVRDAIRSNPGIMLLDKGVVKDKWAWRDFPESAISH